MMGSLVPPKTWDQLRDQGIAKRDGLRKTKTEPALYGSDKCSVFVVSPEGGSSVIGRLPAYQQFF